MGIHQGIELVGKGGNVRTVSGELARRKGEPDAKYFNGTLDAVFVNARQHAIHTTAILDDENHLKLTYSDWPVWDRKTGRYLGGRSVKEDWTRSATR